MQFWQFCRKVFNGIPKKTFEATTFSTKSFHQKYSSEIIDSSYDNPAKKKFNRSPIKNYDFVCFFKQKSSPTMFLWYIRIQFWQTFRKVFAWNPQKIIKMQGFFQKNSLTMFLWWNKMQFWQFCQNFSIRSLKKII